MEIVMIGYAGEAGSRRIYTDERYRKKLLSSYAERFFRVFSEKAEDGEKGAAACAEAEAESRAALKEAQPDAFRAAAEASGIPCCSAGEGGIFAALWELLKAQKTGADFDQSRILVRQQTVEICEFFGLNPYRLFSGGTVLLLSAESGRLLAAAKEAGLPAAVIGYTRKGPAIRRTDGAEIAYLRKPEPDELYKLFGEEKEDVG